MIEKRKVLVYITRNNRLLLFTHPYSPEAALREAHEETGLQRLRMGDLVGELRRDMSDFGINQIHHRYYYHLWCDEVPPEQWRHGELDPSDEGQRAEPIPFDFFWVSLNDVPPLIAGQDAFIPLLIAHFKLSGVEDFDEHTGISDTRKKTI